MTCLNLADLPPDVQAFFAAQTAELIKLKQNMLGLNLTHAAAQKRLKSEKATERDSFTKVIQNRDTIIADLRLQLDGHKKHRFGSRSESLDQLTLELILEEHEIEQAAETDDAENGAASEKDAKAPRTPRKRKPFPKDLKRGVNLITPSDACTECGGRFKELGADVMEELEYRSRHREAKHPPASGLHLL